MTDLTLQHEPAPPDEPATDLKSEALYDLEANRRVMERQQAECAARTAEGRLQHVTYARQLEPTTPENAEPFPAIVGALALRRRWSVLPLNGKIPFKGSG